MNFSITITLSWILHLLSIVLVFFAIYQGFDQKEWLRAILDMLIAMYVRDLAKNGGFVRIQK